MTFTRVSTDEFGPWAVVTGASAGIGREFVRQLAASGLDVVLVARRTGLLTDLGAEIEHEYGVRHRVVTVDLSRPDGPDHLARATAELDVGLLVSNAGDLLPGEFLGRDLHHAVHSLHLNAYSHLTLAHHFGNRFSERGKGGVLLVGAAGAEHGIPWLAAHAASKAYVNALGRGLHAEFASRGLRMTVLTPGPTRTELQDRRSLPDTGLAVSHSVSAALDALRSGRVEVAPGLAARLLRLLPPSLSRRISGRTMAAVSSQTDREGGR